MRKTSKKIVNDPVIIRIIDTLKIRHLSQNDLIHHLELPNGTFTSWKYNGGKSYTKYIDQIAEYLNVSNRYLLYGEAQNFQNTSLLPSEVERYKKLRQLTEAQRNHIYESIDLFWDANHQS
jgi:hypothetical protein